MKPIIKVENLSKRYRIGAPQASYATLRDTLTEALRQPLKRLRRNGPSASETLWALKDVGFKVWPGEVVGIIGRNGAGKSTLLKILSRITDPTSGRIELYGRVGSLLEVGTGFHPELTGRENIFLNGTILGMKRAEILRKFDEIVVFSEIEKFIDTPVKWYSSGMYLRLAFSVAVHLESEILIMDEVLAVGDISFQHKCLDKMHDIRQQGRTILFVSHNMPAVTRLCRRVVLLDEGKILADGPAEQVVETYLSSSLSLDQGFGGSVTAEREWADPNIAPGNEVVRLRKVRVCTEDGRTTSVIDIRRAVGIEVAYDVLRPGHVLIPNYHFRNEDGVHLFAVQDVGSDWRRRPRPVGRYVSTAWIPGNFLSESSLIIDIAVSSHIPSTTIHAYGRDAVAFQVIDNLEGNSARGDYTGAMPGVVRPLVNWTTGFNAEVESQSLLSEEIAAGT